MRGLTISHANDCLPAWIENAKLPTADLLLSPNGHSIVSQVTESLGRMVWIGEFLGRQTQD